VLSLRTHFLTKAILRTSFLPCFGFEAAQTARGAFGFFALGRSVLCFNFPASPAGKKLLRIAYAMGLNAS